MKKEVQFDVVCFDVDSTLVTFEGVDWLAQQKGVGGKVNLITKLTMDGEMSMENVFEKKIDLLAPSREELKTLGRYYCQRLTAGAENVVQTLHELGIEVWLVTGGLFPAIVPLARMLKIPEYRIHANEVYFDQKGNYKGINMNCSLTRSDGKAVCARAIGKGKRLAFVGDGITDLATKPVVKTFIGFGGVVVRPKVKEEAEYFIKSESLNPLLWLLFS